MATKEALEKVTIGKILELSDYIILKEYDLSWTTIYEAEKRKIVQALAGNALFVAHVGSTSVPGLCAKPIIDILLLVNDSDDEASYVPALENAGYVMRVREPDWFGHRMLKGMHPEVNLHVFSMDCSEAQRMLDFKEWLRIHESDRRLYAAAKRSLAQQKWKYLQDYADAKSEVVRKIFKRIVAAYHMRLLGEQDILQMQDLFQSTVLCVNSAHYSQEEVEDWASCGESFAHWQALLEKNRFIGIFDRQERLIGFSSMNSEGHLHSLFVHKDWQGKGVASALLVEVERMAKEYDVPEITSEVSISARPFFEKRGYKVIRTQKAKARRLCLTNFVMKKVL